MFELDIDSAIAAHKAWFESLRAAIDGIDAKRLMELTVADHTKCVLGAWLHSNDYGPLECNELFRSIEEVHIEFHQIAVEILDHLEQGDAHEAQRLLEKKLPFVSEALVLLLEEFRSQQSAR